jgi:hypothetical protein
MANNMDAVDRGKQLLVMTVDIGDGRQDFITVCEHDDPSYLASEFAAKYNLDSTLQRNLKNMISENTQEVLKNGLHLREPSEDGSVSQSPFLSPIKTENFQHADSRADKSQKQEIKYEPTRGSVYGAVYKQLRKSTNSKSMSSVNSQSKSKKGGYNYGDYLYAKGIKDKEQAEKFKEMKKQELFEKEIHNFTFSPLINTNSSVISPRVYDKPENILMQKKAEKEERLKKLKEEYDKEQNKECYFVPKINKASKNREMTGNIYKELYSQAEKKREMMEKRQEESYKSWSFRPDVGTAHKRNCFETTEQFLDRLDTSKKTNEEQLEKLRKVQKAIEMGQTEEKPKNSIVQSNKTISRYNSEPIWEYLYNQKDAKKKESEISQLEFAKVLENASVSKKTSEKSDKIYDNFRLKQYEKLFKEMDSDKDGVISGSAINIATIEVPLLKVLTPFFEELEKNQGNMNLQEFCSRAEDIYRGLNVEQRAVFTRRPGKKGPEEVEKKPFVSQTSVVLAEKKRSKLPADFLERQSTVVRMEEMKAQKKREEKEAEELKECTFRPSIKSN